MKILATFTVLAAATIGSASATMLQYDTSGSIFTGAGFTTGSGTATVTLVSGADTVTLTYNGPGAGVGGTGPVSVNTPSNVSYGFIQLTFAGNTTSVINLPAFTFNLHVNDQTDSTTASFVGTAAASTIAANSSNLNISWTPNPLADGGAFFTINTPTSIPSDNTLNGQASLQGGVTDTVPEPGSLFLLGAGLLGLGFSARKQFAKRS